MLRISHCEHGSAPPAPPRRQTVTAPPRLRQAAALGACAGGMAVAAMLALRLAAGVTSLLEVIGSGLALLLPGPWFGTLIDALQERGRPLLLLGTAVLVIVVGAVLGALVAPRLAAVGPGSPSAPVPSSSASRWRWLVAALVLWLLTQPLALVAEGGFQVAAVLITLGDWLLLCGLVEILVSLAPRGVSSSGVRGSASFASMSRRRFLAALGGVLGAISLGYLGSRILGAHPPAVGLGQGATAPGTLPEGVTPTADFYIVSKDLLGPPRIDPGSWRLELTGIRSRTIGYPQLMALPQRQQVETLECISNPVGGTLISNGSWRGVQLNRLLAEVGIPRGTTTVIFRCADGYSESLPLAEALAPSTLVATGLNGSRLPPQHGFPARILAPGHYGMKDPKWLTSISTSPLPFSGYWEQQGWNPSALPHIFSRFDFPPGNTRLRSQRAYLLTGVAYAGSLGVQRVEVSVDGGARWVPAHVQPQLSPYAWSVWSLPWQPSPGLYALSVRAVDKQGRVQTATATGSYPNGASGREEIVVSVV